MDENGEGGCEEEDEKKEVYVTEEMEKSPTLYQELLII